MVICLLFIHSVRDGQWKVMKTVQTYNKQTNKTQLPLYALYDGKKLNEGTLGPIHQKPKIKPRMITIKTEQQLWKALKTENRQNNDQTINSQAILSIPRYNNEICLNMTEGRGEDKWSLDAPKSRHQGTRDRGQLPRIKARSQNRKPTRVTKIENRLSNSTC